MFSAHRRTQRRGEGPAIYGREQERAQLLALLDDAISGDGSLVLISGEAGIGKTTLVDDLIHEAEGRGCLTLTGGCYDLTATPPYGAWIEVIRGYKPDGPLPIVPTWFANPEQLERVGSQTALFEETHRFFVAIAEHQPLVLVLEDLHWADQASVEALRYLGRQLARSRLLLVITLRRDELVHGVEISQLLPLIIHESRASRMHLTQISRDAIYELVASRYRVTAEDAERLVEHVWKRSEGNPFFAGEILLGLEEEHVLVQEEGGWKLGGLERVPVPVVLRQILERRLARLTAQTRTALQVASVIGQEIKLELWRSVANIETSEFEQALAEALDLRLIEETVGTASLRFRHALLREALYTSLLISARQALHRQIGERMLEHPNPDPHAVAHHFRQANDARTAEWLIRAGNRAEQSYALSGASASFEAALPLLEQRDGAGMARGWLHFRIARLLRLSDQHTSLAHAETAIRLAAAEDDLLLEAHARTIRGLVLCFIGQLSDGLTELRRSIETGQRLAKEGLPSGADYLRQHGFERTTFDPEHYSTETGLDVTASSPLIGSRALTAIWLARIGRFAEAIDLGQQNLSALGLTEREIAAGEIQSWNAGSSLQALGPAYAWLGQADEARQAFSAAFDINRRMGYLSIAALDAYRALHLYLLPLATDDVAARRQLVAQGSAVAQAASAGTGAPHPFSDGFYPVEILEGRWDKATVLLERASEHLPILEKRKIAQATRAQLARETGDNDLAASIIQELLPRGAETEPGTIEFHPVILAQQIAVDLMLDAGCLDDAAHWLAANERWLERSGAVLGRAENQLSWSRYHRLLNDARTAHIHAERALKHALDPRQPLAQIAAQRLLGQLAVDQHKYDAAEHRLALSLELAERCDAPHERALTLLVLAKLAVARGLSPEARHLLREARAICEQLGAKRSLKRADEIAATLRRTATDHPAGLSDREVEVLEQAATGMTNAEIGEALYISPRTVAQHLRSVYNKLGVNSRAAAVARWAELRSG